MRRTSNLPPVAASRTIAIRLAIAALVSLTASDVLAQGGAGGAAGGAGARGGGRGGDTTAAGRQGGARGGRDAGAAPAIPNGVLGGLRMTAADSVVKQIVERLDFNAYKETIRALTRFGDREQGTQRNVDAMLWIESQLKSWGYTVERITYDYRSNIDSAASKREEVYATKIGTTVPQEMYIVGAHMDGRGGGEAANDDGSGTALVMEMARILAASEIQTARSIRFALWNNEETGTQGAQAYIAQRQALQGIENPPGSKKYPEPKWLGMIQHDMMMWDHGNPVQFLQVLDADVDIEFQMNSTMADQSAALALKLLGANRMFATDYPAAMSGSMSNTDSAPFQNLVAAVSLRENRRLYETGRRANPHWHQRTDLFVTFSDADFRLGFNAMQTTLSAVSKLVEAKIVK